MNHKFWPILSAALFLSLLAATLLLFLSGCSDPAEPEVVAEVKESPRFTGEYIGMDVGVARYYTITDTKTGVQYLLVSNNYGMAMAALEE